MAAIVEKVAHEIGHLLRPAVLGPVLLDAVQVRLDRLQTVGIEALHARLHALQRGVGHVRVDRLVVREVGSDATCSSARSTGSTPSDSGTSGMIVSSSARAPSRSSCTIHLLW
jgi:hypothetical protein